MPVDHIRYDLLTQQALRAVVRRVLADVAKSGSLPGEHHFYVTFDTRGPGVKVSSRLRAQYPEDMTIVLQHQFWDLVVSETYFEVALSFNGITEKLHVPLDAVKGFFDPSVQFGLQFETVTEPQSALGPKEVAASEPPAEDTKPRLKRKLAEPDAPAAIGPAVSAKAEATKAEPEKPEPAKPALVAGTDKPEPDKPSGGAEVVRLDRFRKK
jgi:hypothetical protein